MSSIFVPKITSLYSNAFLQDYPTVDCESPERVGEIRAATEGLVKFVEPDLCSETDLGLCHSTQLIRSVQRHPEVYGVAILAAGAAIKAAELCLEGPTFSMARPPGHHAGRDFNGGFCFFNNVAVAVRKLQALGKANSALIIDIDLHYGNGTFDIFKTDTSVAFRNISAGTRHEFFDELETALSDASSYDLVACSAGFDTYIKDWGALLSTEDFKTMGSRLARSNSHFFSVLEGGYYISDLGKNVHSFLSGIQEACS
jgi:acetoin utilization deacetylase AcuC-like enzyme